MLQFQYPELLLLGLPLWFAYRRWGAASGMTGILRLTILVLLLLIMAGPELNVGGTGTDVILVADRSRSMPANAHNHLRELIQNLQRNRGPGDRLGLVTFGSEAAIEQPLSEQALLGEYTQPLLPDGSDLSAALETALTLVDKNRPARILVLSDGESNGPSPLSPARRAREEGVPIDYRLFERNRIGDVAVDSILLPETVTPYEPFQFSVWIYADREVAGRVRILRNGREFAKRDATLSTGMNRLLFRDMLPEPGLFSYTVDVDIPDDPLRENNRGAGVVRVEGGPKVLVLNSDGRESNLTNALHAGQIPFDVVTALEHPLSQDSLEPYRAVIVENVPAGELGNTKMERLAQFAEDLGGGLMLTGGERSFGTGGYFGSPLDETLPVSMELREEHRKTNVALAIALDRSGSMGMPVRGGKTKMDLANLGTAACIELLSAGDSIAVLAVDTVPHLIQPLTPVDNKAALMARAKRIESMGGGIYVYEALVAAGKELMKAPQSTKHIILFSDAADSEEPGDYKNLLKKFEKAGITVSVIGLGTRADPDAKLLEDIAQRGRGNIMFTADAQELPRLFAEDTMSIARSSFVKKDEDQPAGIPGYLLPGARLMGDLGTGGFPAVDGYNLSYLKPDATAAVISQDEYQAPWSAFWHRGLGRVAALTVEVDGPYSGQFGQWDSYEDFLITHVRWLLGNESPDEFYVQVERDGQDALITVELDPERDLDSSARPPQLLVVPPGSEREAVREPEFVWVGPHTLQARFRMDRTGTFRTLIKSGPRDFLRGPVVTLPYSPEYVPRVGQPTGAETLASVAELTGGKRRTDILEVFADPPRSARTAPLFPWLIIGTLVLWIVEIGGRRLSLWERNPFRKNEETDAEPETAFNPSAAPTVPKTGWFSRFKTRRHRKTGTTSRPSSAKSAATTAASESTSSSAQSSQTDSSTARPENPRSTSSLFEQAKQRARRRTDE